MSNQLRILALVAGDLAAFMLFAAIGRGSHGQSSGLAAIGDVAMTAAPFAIGWLLVAPLAGAYRPDDLRATLGRTALAWTLALPVGSLLRALIIGRLSPVSFYLVTYLAALLILLIWRGAFAALAGRRAAKA